MDEQPESEKTDDSKVNGALGCYIGALAGVPLSGLVIYLWDRFWPLAGQDGLEYLSYLCAVPVSIVTGAVVGYLILVKASLK